MQKKVDETCTKKNTWDYPVGSMEGNKFSKFYINFHSQGGNKSIPKDSLGGGREW